MEKLKKVCSLLSYFMSLESLFFPKEEQTSQSTACTRDTRGFVTVKRTPGSEPGSPGSNPRSARHVGAGCFHLPAAGSAPRGSRGGRARPGARAHPSRPHPPPRRAGGGGVPVRLWLQASPALLPARRPALASRIRRRSACRVLIFRPGVPSGPPPWPPWPSKSAWLSCH